MRIGSATSQTPGTLILGSGKIPRVESGGGAVSSSGDANVPSEGKDETHVS